MRNATMLVIYNISYFVYVTVYYYFLPLFIIVFSFASGVDNEDDAADVLKDTNHSKAKLMEFLTANFK